MQRRMIEVPLVQRLRVVGLLLGEVGVLAQTWPPAPRLEMPSQDEYAILPPSIDVKRNDHLWDVTFKFRREGQPPKSVFLAGGFIPPEDIPKLKAMGARPIGYLLAASFPRGLTQGWMESFVRGLAADQRAFAISLIGVLMLIGIVGLAVVGPAILGWLGVG